MVRITLKAARVNAGYTQNEAANRLGVDVSTVRCWESGRTHPHIKNVRKICDLYGVGYDNLLFFDNESGFNG